MTDTANHSYGWKPQLPDQRDHLLVVRPSTATLPAVMDLSRGMPPVYDQGQLGSCTANAIAGAYEFDLNLQGLPFATPSRLFIYYCERALEGTTRQDAGAYIRDGFKVLAKTGACLETTWPYVISKFSKKPPKKAYTEASAHQSLEYLALTPTLDQLKGCIAAGYPFVFGFSVYASFESAEVARTGDAPMPAPHEQLLGGHAVLACGYDDATQRFKVRNSWGTGWGKQGYFTLPYAYLTNANLASDFWTMRRVEG